MSFFAHIIALFLLVGCVSENPNKQPLQAALTHAKDVQQSVDSFDMDSIISVRERLNAAKEDVRWLGVEASVEFVRSDAPIIGKLSEASRYLKDAPQRFNSLTKESSRCISQIEGLLNVIDSGATIDAKGDTITQEYINENASREIKAVEKLQEVYDLSEHYFNLGLETDEKNWTSIDSLITAKKGVWARSIAEE